MLRRVVKIQNLLPSFALTGALCGIAVSPRVFAQEAPKVGAKDAKEDALNEADARRVLTEVMRERVNRLVLRFVPASEFLVSVQVSPVVPLLADVPYVPAVQTSMLLLEMAPDDLKQQYKDVKIEVRISKRFDAESRATLAALIQADLGVASPDSVKISDLAVQGAAVDDGIQRQLKKAEDDLRAARTEMEQLKRERNDAKNELMLKNNLQKEPPAAAAAAPDAAKKPEDAKPSALEEMLLRYAPLAAGAVLLFLMIFLASKMFASAIRSVGAGITLIANSLSSVGGAMKVKAETEAEDKKNKDAKPEAAPVAAAVAPSGGGGGGGANSDLTDRIMRLNKELLEGLNERTENLVLKALTTLLARPETVAKGVATLELLGKSKAGELFARLGKESRAAVQSFLLDGNYGRPKFELMLESGEELKTKLLGEGFGQLRGEFTIKLAQELLTLSEEDLFQVAAALDPDLKARYFVYMEPAVLSAMVQRFETEKRDQFDAVVDAMAGLAKVERDTTRDDAIVQAIKDFQAKKVDDPDQRYMPYFQQLVESLQGDLAEKTVERIGATNPTLKAQLSRFVVTFKTLFKLPVNVRKEVLDPFSNKQLAALAFGMEASLRGDLMTCIIERRHEQINDELGFLTEMNPKDARPIVEAAQAAVVASLKKMRANGSLQEYLDAADKAPESAPAPASVKSAA